MKIPASYTLLHLTPEQVRAFCTKHKCYGPPVDVDALVKAKRDASFAASRERRAKRSKAK